MADIITTITASPTLLSFAGNPIIYKVKTSKSLGSDESFLRIRCKAVFSLNGSVGSYSGNANFTTEMSQPVENLGTAVFNLSDAAQTLVRNVQSSFDMEGEEILSSYGIIANIEFKTVWVYENAEFESSAEYAPMLFIIPGAFTDFEMLSFASTDLLSLTSEGKLMTRKPDGGILYKGETLIVPTVYGFYDVENPGTLDSKIVSHSLSVGGLVVSDGSSLIECNKLDYQVVSAVNEGSDGDFVFESTVGRSLSGYYMASDYGVHFLRFVNGFGAVENISVRSRDKLSYEVSGENHSLVQEIGVRPTDRRYSTKKQPVGVYELSSGYVPQRWAEWYVQELLASPRVWIQLGGKWIPALIESSDECVIYDRSNPEMPHVDFTLRLAVDGVTGCVW